jgi:hypothetical protein
MLYIKVSDLAAKLLFLSKTVYDSVGHIGDFGGFIDVLS